MRPPQKPAPIDAKHTISGNERETGTASSAPAGFRLSLLGGFSLSDPSGQERIISSKKNRALLGILALSPRLTATRERLAGMLWGDFGQEQARSSLRQSLTVLRRDIGSEQLVWTQDDSVSINAECFSSDVFDLLAGEQQNGKPELRQAAAAWRGELLPDLALHEELYEGWLRAQRSRLSASAATLFERLYHLETGAQRVDAALRLVQLDPLSEASHRLLMQAYAMQGDRGLALKQFETCRDLLKTELNVEPGETTLALRNKIASERAVPPPSSQQAPVKLAADPEPEAERFTIAVLPFDNASIDSEQVFLSDGITEDIIASLSRFRQLTVIARSSSFAFRGVTADHQEIARSLNAGYVLHGSVRRAGQRLRVMAELRHVSSHVAIWTERFDRDVDDVFGVIDELSAAITATTIGKIEDEVLKQLRQKPPERYDAYELVLRGRHLLHVGDVPSRLKARQHLEEALVLDPQFALAKVHFALTYLQDFFFDDSGTALDKASEIANDALLLDDSEPWCHMVLGLTHLHRRRFQLAVRHAERAVALNSSDPKLIAKLALVLIDTGRPDEAITHIRKAMQLTPLSPEDYADYLALAYYSARRYRDAWDAMQVLPSDTFYYHVWLAAISYRLDDADAAKQYCQNALRIAPDFTIGRYAKMEPIQNPHDLAHWTDAFAAVGFPQ